MKIFTFLIPVLILWLALASARGDLIVASSTNGPVAIPDSNALGLQQTIEVTGQAGWIDSLSVSLNISGINDGAFNGDFYATLQHGSGFVVLLNRVGVTGLNALGYGNNGFSVTLNQGGDDIHLYQNFTYTLSLAGALTGTWGVDGRTTDPLFVTDASPRDSSLHSFTNASPNGSWTLFIADVSAGGEGQLDSWSVNMNVVPEPAAISMLLLGLLVARSRKLTGRVKV